MRSSLGICAKMAVFASATLFNPVALGQAVQVLDSVDAFGRNSPTSSTVLEMAFRDSDRDAPFSPLNVGATSLLACQRAADQGLYCIDGSTVRLWPDTKRVMHPQLIPDQKLFSCNDRDFGFDVRRPNPCTSITVDLNGALWVAGRKANSHSLVKVVAKDRLAACSATGSIATGWVELDRIDSRAPVFCAREWAPGRPVLVDINPVDGEVTEGFTNFPSILGLEERKTVVLFPDVASASGGPARQPIEFASGKAGWNLVGNEQLLGVSLLQFGDPKQNYVLVTTTLGRVLAKKADPATGMGFGAAFRVFKFNTGRCSGSGEQNYGIRVSSQSGRVYVSDRFCKEVVALELANEPTDPTDCESGAAFCLTAATEGTADTPVVLSTGPDVNPDGISVAPGIGIDLRDCGFDASGNPKACPLIGDGNGNNFDAAELKGVRLVDSSKNGMTVFQVKGIPDCRWWPTHPACVELQIDVGPDDYLDVSNLLPYEVIKQAETKLGTSLPSLLISPKYRGQDGSRQRMQPGQPGVPGYAPTIDLFFGITESDVQFRDTFGASFDIADLAGQEWGCAAGIQVVKDANGNVAPPDAKWDVVATVSEKWATVGGPSGVVEGPAKEHVDMLVTTGCVNPTQVSGSRWSLYAYNLEVVAKGDSVYAILMRSLYQDLKDAQNKTACDSVDGQVNAPIGSCTDLDTKWQAAYEKLDRCIIGATFPRQSEAVNNCQSFLSQLTQYESTLNAVPVITANDPANRIGELKTRARVVRYVFENHFLPSIPPDGFRCDTASTGDCGR